MQSTFNDGIVAGVVTHEVGHAISVLHRDRISRFESTARAERLVAQKVIRSFVSKEFADHVIKDLKAGSFDEYFAEAYAIWLTDRASLPEPLVRFFDELQ